MGRFDYYADGDNNTICDVCGQKYKASQLKKRWDGVWVCPKDWEMRNPQDFVRGVVDNQTVPLSRPEAPDAFIPMNFTQYPTEQAGVTELIFTTSVFFRFIGMRPTPFEGAINNQVVNLLALNGSQTTTDTNPETVALSEGFALNPNKVFSDSLSISESVVKSITSSISENITLFESETETQAHTISESASLVESNNKNTGRVSSDSLGLVESVLLNFQQKLSLNSKAINTSFIG